jgi:hypothetical protein
LEVDVLEFQEAFEHLGAFIVKALELGFEASIAQTLVQDFVGFGDAMGGKVFERLSKNMIAIIVVQNHEVVVAVARGYYKAARLISEDLTSGFQKGNMAVMCLVFQWGRKIIGVTQDGVGLRGFDECRLG